MTDTSKNKQNIKNNKGENIMKTFENTNLKSNYNKAVNAVLTLKQELTECKTAAEKARDAANDYRNSLKKSLQANDIAGIELFKAVAHDTEYLRLLKIADSFNIELLKTALNCAYDNLGRAIHNIMLFEARENLKNIIKYKVGYKRFAACFKIGEMSPDGFYSYGECRLPYAVDNQYCNFRHYIFDNKIEADKISNYTPYDIFTAEEIKEEVKMAYDARKAAAEKLEALRKELEAENKKRKFYDLQIKNIHLLNINTLDR